MVIDTSAIVAIFLDEPDAPAYGERIVDDPVRLVSAATLVEAAMVIESRFGDAGGAELDLWLHRTGAEIVAVSAEHADQARRAWRRYGKGRHPAGLNYGDCFSYALAKLTGEPLLFKGDDFSKADISPAWPRDER
ncbi:MAG: type II toxin-antitoxin system VapC family toxin [Aquamicrobium sp.]|uniref:type II toxin-antitoxin system VapC family toxin n=1 Tax=Aquamicrobium sp. TaxID=1872579 RepID=UPI00349EFC88|nr:type II toxin-antitoxin system VapC family toxin [Aquamicrobium sp.]